MIERNLRYFALKLKRFRQKAKKIWHPYIHKIINYRPSPLPFRLQPLTLLKHIPKKYYTFSIPPLPRLPNVRELWTSYKPDIRRFDFYKAAILLLLSLSCIIMYQWLALTAQETHNYLSPPSSLAAIKENLASISPAAGEDNGSDPTLNNQINTYNPPENLSVQAVLVPEESAVIASTLESQLIYFPLKNGDIFEQGDILARFDCGEEYAQREEIESKLRMAELNLKASDKLLKLDSLSKIEHARAVESLKQVEAAYKQMEERLSLCEIVAPFNGRVTERLASLNEHVQKGRVILEISSLEKLQAEFLIPSNWLRWLNIGSKTNISIEESGKSYGAKITRIYGKVDPISRSVQVVAQLNTYQEELLPGMSGKATFDPMTIKGQSLKGFLGLDIEENKPLEDQAE